MLIPVLNRDSEWLRQWVEQKTSVPDVQKRLVLVVVSVALLLDNMLYMVSHSANGTLFTISCFSVL